tara:strand:+ start:205 stop:402 length:198 start_codon:yes stop_codon:yes gene_type:complete
MMTMPKEIKDKVAELERRKIDLNEELAVTNSANRMKSIEEELYEINDTIKKLTENVEPEFEWYGS